MFPFAPLALVPSPDTALAEPFCSPLPKVFWTRSPIMLLRITSTPTLQSGPLIFGYG
jgi:hypothetical protein